MITLVTNTDQKEMICIGTRIRHAACTVNHTVTLESRTMPIATLNDDLLIAIFTALDQWDLPRASQVCQNWRFLVTQTSSLWLDVHDDDGYYDRTHWNPPFHIALARSRGADVRFIDNSTGKLGVALPQHLKRTTGLVLDINVDKIQNQLLAKLCPQTPLVKLRSLYLDLCGHLAYARDRPDFKRLNETNLPALRHFGLCGIKYPLDVIMLPNLLTLHVELIDHRRDICALVRRYIDRPLRELWFWFRKEGSDNAREVFPEDVAKRLGALNTIYAWLPRPRNIAMDSDTFQQLLAGTTAEVQLTHYDHQPNGLKPAEAVRAAEASVSARNGTTTLPPSTWNLCIAEQNDDDFGRPAGLRTYALTLSSVVDKLVRRIVFKWNSQLGDQLSLLMREPELTHLELDGVSMCVILNNACRVYPVDKLGVPAITTLTIWVSAHHRSASIEKLVKCWIHGEVGKTLSRIDTLIVRARPFEQVEVSLNDLVALIRRLRLPHEGKVLRIRTAGVWLRRAATDDPELPPGVILDI